MGIFDELIERARGSKKVIVLPECDSFDTFLLAREMINKQLGRPMFVGEGAVIHKGMADAGINPEDVDIFDTDNKEACEELVKAGYAASNKRFTFPEYKERYSDAMGYGMMLVVSCRAHGIFTGHVRTTADVFMYSIRIIGMRDDIKTASLSAIVDTPEKRFVITDCALNTDPTPEKLAHIAVSAARFTESTLGVEPRVAFLSFSTDGSGEGKSVEKIRQSLEIMHRDFPQFISDGEFQLDAAIDPAVANAKVKRESEVAGQANVLVFPSLDSANIGVKILQRFARAHVVGHLISGLKMPVSDSSRGAKLDEMTADVALLLLA